MTERLVRYARIDTQAARGLRERSPSTPGQLDLGRLLVTELHAIGLTDALLDSHGYVMATLPGPAGSDVIGLVAHVDVSPDAPGSGVEPIVHRGYDGGTIILPRGDTVLDPATMPILLSKVGHDIVTSSGDTLLGADDKAGVAEIMTAVAYLAAHPELPRPTIRVCFTPDEEIGEGATLFDLDSFGARCAYTLDGSEIGELQDETFTAAAVTIDVKDVDVHPGFATGKLVNAATVAAHIVAALPTDRLTPTTTSGKEGFIHPLSISAELDRAALKFILRDFTTAGLKEKAAVLERAVRSALAGFPRSSCRIEVKEQYRNMKEVLDKHPQVVEHAMEAVRRAGLTPRKASIRGGTDGSRLSFLGLPCPNIFAGEHAFHSRLEWVSVQDMQAAVRTIVHLATVWEQQA